MGRSGYNTIPELLKYDIWRSTHDNMFCFGFCFTTYIHKNMIPCVMGKHGSVPGCTFELIIVFTLVSI